MANAKNPADNKNEVNVEKAVTSATESQAADGFDEKPVTDHDAQLTTWDNNVKIQENEKAIQASKSERTAKFDDDFVQSLPTWQQGDPASWGYRPPNKVS